MKAVIWTKYGSPDSLKIQEIAKPVPKDDQVLIRVHATTVTAGDCEIRRLELPLMLGYPMRLYIGLTKPIRIRILGQELAGVIEQVGKKVRSFQEGDEVFGTTGFGFGAYAEYICLPEKPDETQGILAAKPTNISFGEAAAIPTAGLEALHFLQAANIQPGEKVLIIGGGGSIGTYSIQLAKYFGAEVTGVDSSEKTEFMLSVGADRCIDYLKEDYTKDDQRYDLIIDVVGKHSVTQRLKLLKPDGIYYLAYAKPSHIVLGKWVSITSGKKLKIESSSQQREDLDILKELIEAGKLRAFIDKNFPLEQIPEAHRYAESGQKRGNISITVFEE
jgi:NADPH:quinone reductase-like Zn-dependent oxidoreductase